MKREVLHEVKGYRIEETDFMVKSIDIDLGRVLEWTYVRYRHSNDASLINLYILTLNILFHTGMDVIWKMSKSGICSNTTKRTWNVHRKSA